MFNTLSDRLTSVLNNLRGKGRLSEADIDATAREIRVALLEADVALPVVRTFIAKVKERAKGAEVSQALNPAQQVVKIVNEELIAILGGETRRLNLAKNPPSVIMLAGLQGAGKTTLAGKLAKWLRGQGHTPMLVACDLQRPNAVTQLQVVGERAGVPVFAPEPGNGVGDPVDVARRGIEEAKRAQHDIVLVDTAGRLGVDEEMMRQAIDIRAAVQPDEVLFVVDAMIGQDAVNTATAFRDGVGFTGVVLTKLDGDARGGAALSVREVTGQPILFASNGEKLEDFDVFHPDRMASRILGMGDMLTLIEQAEQAFDAEQAEAAAMKMGSGQLTLEDFLEQMLTLRKMGPIANLLGMLPGAGQMKDQLANLDEKHLDRVQAIIRGMTPAEREDPKIINASRRLRIANGSGVRVSDVNDLVNRFFEARKMMSQMAGRFGLPGARGPKGKGKKGKKGKKGRGPTPPKIRGGFPGMLPGGMPPGMPPGMGQLPPGLDGGGLNDLPPGFDPTKFKFPK
ncbi:signal recognition particle protein [Saccharothrix variisporea]|uniref:Signal recognition particle protein n=1 Tax=Saccharothrix variisporea TaxID=543527 RepID=A0A495XGZ6_9PSEU|nr:signal recognition particle protein [Saccharothrix variisporea]RKT73009.1 signal recognition particle subunit FFH/SRP54 (srp54) [Saccharothrix variisporea]